MEAPQERNRSPVLLHSMRLPSKEAKGARPGGPGQLSKLPQRPKQVQGLITLQTEFKASYQSGQLSETPSPSSSGRGFGDIGDNSSAVELA